MHMLYTLPFLLCLCWCLDLAQRILKQQIEILFLFARENNGVRLLHWLLICGRSVDSSVVNSRDVNVVIDSYLLLA
jgi:hypothetical protein